MQKIKILSVGKNKEKWLEEAFEEYTKRLSPLVYVEFHWAKNEEQLEEWCKKETFVLCLDSTGRLFSSEEFSKYLFQQMEKSGSRLTFVIGGAEGLSPEIKSKGPLISLSPLTFTHQIVRLILLEQLYRSFEIQRGSPYHK